MARRTVPTGFSLVAGFPKPDIEIVSCVELMRQNATSPLLTQGTSPFHSFEFAREGAAEGVESVLRRGQRCLALGNLGKQCIYPRHDAALFSNRCKGEHNLFHRTPRKFLECRA